MERLVGAALPVRRTASEALERQVFTELSDIWSLGVLVHVLSG